MTAQPEKRYPAFDQTYGWLYRLASVPRHYTYDVKPAGEGPAWHELPARKEPALNFGGRLRRQNRFRSGR